MTHTQAGSIDQVSQFSKNKHTKSHFQMHVRKVIFRILKFPRVGKLKNACQAASKQREIFFQTVFYRSNSDSFAMGKIKSSTLKTSASTESRTFLLRVFFKHFKKQSKQYCFENYFCFWLETWKKLQRKVRHRQDLNLRFFVTGYLNFSIYPSSYYIPMHHCTKTLLI